MYGKNSKVGRYNFSEKTQCPYLRPQFMMLPKKIILCNSWMIVLILLACNNEHSSKVETTQQPATVQTDSPKSTITKDTTTVKKDTTVALVSKPIVFDTTKKYIYLTFDDGPQNGTQICVNICKDLGVKATFFMVGEHACSPKTNHLVDTIRGAYPFFLLANHSYSHAKGQYHKFYNHPASAAEDFYATQQKLHVPFPIIRLPGNSAWVRKGEIKASGLVKPVCKILDSAGYNVIGWDAEWEFTRDKHCFPRQSVSKMLATVSKNFENNDMHTKNHLVILTHDRMFQHQPYSDSLYNFIKALKQNPNYVFETVDHYPGLK
jgi:peptidoglycan-N-acetylglucosamine deacetylase